MDYIAVYIEIAVVTIVYMAILFFNVRTEMGGEGDVVLFKSLLLSLMLAVIADAVTQAQYRGFLHLNHTLVAFLYGFYMFMFSGVIPFLWFRFVEMRLGGELLKNRTAVVISIIPLAVLSFMAFASMKTGWFFIVDEYGIYTRGQYWSLQIAVNYIYFLFTTVHAFVVARREPSYIQRRQYYILASFVIAPIIGGLFQLHIGNHPFVAPSISISMLLVFINIQGDLIHTDSMTGLYNAQSAESHIDELKANVSEDNPFYVYRIRMDEFRLVNYIHGFDEGDMTVKAVALALQRVGKSYGVFVARLGGVEFLAVLDGKKANKKDDFETAVKKELEKETKKQDLPYELNVVIGRVECSSDEIKTKTLIHEASHDMHADVDVHQEQDKSI